MIILNEATELWEYFKNFLTFDFLFSEKNILLSTCIAALGILISFLSSRYSRNLSVCKEYLEKVVSPIFEICEKFLYQNFAKIRKEDAEHIFKIIDENQLTSGGKFREWRFRLDSDIKEKGYISSKTQKRFLQFIDSEYDKVCKQVGIPVRPWRYRKRYILPFSIKSFFHFFIWLLLFALYIEYCYVVITVNIWMFKEHEYSMAITGMLFSPLLLGLLYKKLDRYR